MEIVDVIKYFSKFPDKTNILKRFKRAGSIVDGYSDLFSEINQNTPLIPELKDLIISTSEKEVANSVKSIDDYFMFIEYGQITGNAPDQMRLRRLNFNLAVYVCFHSNARNMDMFEESLVMDKCLGLLVQIAKQMVADDGEGCPHKRFAESSFNFSPVEPELMYGSLGWGLTFRKTNNIEF